MRPARTALICTGWVGMRYRQKLNLVRSLLQELLHGGVYFQQTAILNGPGLVTG